MSTFTPSRPPRVALIGVGGYGRVYYELIRGLHRGRDLRLSAAAIIDPGQQEPVLRELAGIACEVFGDYREMLERWSGRLDLCLIPTGIPWHAPMTLAALAAGANVLVEKPLAASVREAEEMRAAERDHGRFVAVGFQYHYTPDTLALKRELLDGVIGPLRRIRLLGLWPRNAGYYSRTDWAGRIRLGDRWVLDSPISNAFGHHLSLALFFSGRAAEESAAPVRVMAETFRARPIESFDTAAVAIGTDTGVDIRCYLSHSSRHAIEPEMVLEGDRGRITWLHGRNCRIEAEGRGPRVVAVSDEHVARQVMLRSVLWRLGDPAAFVCGSAVALQHTRCLEGVHAAAPIRDVPADWIENNGESDHHRQVWIRGLEEVFRKAFSEGGTLREVGCPWAG